MSDLAAPGSHYTRRVVGTAIRLVVEDGLPYRAASWALGRDLRVFVPHATIQNRVEDGGEKGGGAGLGRAPQLALSNFSGYIAADELYDGPFCLVSAVDNVFARFLGVDANTVRSWEQGTRPPSAIARPFTGGDRIVPRLLGVAREPKPGRSPVAP